MSKYKKKLSETDRNLIKKLCYSIEHDIMQGTSERPVHVRLTGLNIDVWPTTGTVKESSNKYYMGQGGIKYLGELLGRSVERVKLKMNDRIEALELQVRYLTKTIEDIIFTIESKGGK